MTDPIQHMLAVAYRHLGIDNKGTLNRWVAEALDYLQADREHYIEAAPPDLPEHMITTQHGIICRMVPLAQAIKTETKRNYVRQDTTVLLLCVTENNAQYVLEHSVSCLYDNPAKNTYAYPVYRCAKLQDLPDALEALPPRKIAPVATPAERDSFGMIFTAISKFSQQPDLNVIPRNTERAVRFARYAPEKTLILNGQTVTGKLIPLAQQESMWDEMRTDHTYSYSKTLCLLITEDTRQYVIKTYHIYRYFRKAGYDDVPGGCAYEPTENKHEITYENVKLENISETFHPSFY